MRFQGIFISTALASLAILGSGCDRSSTLATASKPAGGTPGNTRIPVAATLPVADTLPAQIGFNEDIQPILSEYCYHCHGPDSGTRKPKDEPLRLDRPAEAFKVRANGKPVIVKGDADASLLVKLIHSTDPDEVMPPPESHKTPTPREIALVEKMDRARCRLRAPLVLRQHFTPAGPGCRDRFNEPD